MYNNFMDKESIKVYSPGVYEIENFISDSTGNLLLSYVNLNGDEGWQDHGPGTTESSDSLVQTFCEEGEKIENKILSLFNNVDRCNSMRKIRRLKAGEYIHSHVDLIPSENVAKIKFGIILYLNDDFDGGEIYYKDIDLTIKPKKNSILIHESTIPHEVLRVVNGKRYSMTTFIWGNNETSFIIA